MCFFRFGRIAYQARTNRVPSDLDDSCDIRRSTKANLPKVNPKTVLFRTKRKMADAGKGQVPKRVTRQSTRLGLTLDPKPVSSRVELLAAAKGGVQNPGDRSSVGSRNFEAPASHTWLDPSPVQLPSTSTVGSEPTGAGDSGTSTASSRGASLTENVSIGADGSVSVIKEVTPLESSMMEVDINENSDKSPTDPGQLASALEAINFVPGATLTKEMCDLLLQAVKVQCDTAAAMPRGVSKRIPHFPIEEGGPSRLYQNAALSQHQQHQIGLQHIDGRVASAVARSQVPHRLASAVAPPPAPPAPPGYVPVPGPEFSVQTPSQIDQSGKVGNESVYLRDVVGTSVKASLERSQDIITRLVEWHRGNQGAVVDQNDQLTLVDTLVLPQLAGIAPQVQCLESFIRFVDPQDPIRNTHIYWDNYLESARVPEAARGAFMSGGNPESKTIVSQLRAKADVSNGMANRLCTRLYDATSQYALEGLFFSLFFMADYKFTAEQMEIVVALQAAAEGAITNINLAAEGEAMAGAIAAAEDAIVTKRICFNRIHLSSIHINVLRMASRGPTAFEGDNVAQMIHSYFRMPQINFAIYDIAPPVAVPLATPTAEQIWAAAFHIAQLLHAEADLVRGWVRAQAVVNGKHYEDDQQRGPFYMATLELENLSMPRPVGRNFLWDFFCDRFELLDVLVGVEVEYNTLSTLTMADSRCPGALLAGLITISVSTYFTYFNIGGRELNHWAAMTDAPVTRFLSAALVTRSHNVPPVFQCMVSNLTACTGFILSPSCFRTRAFSAGFVGRMLEADDGWAQTWGRRIPYLIRVISVAWVLSAWHTVWGISGPYPGIHIASELFSTLPDGMRLICMHLGDDSYHKMAQSSTPFVYLFYGLHFMNIFRQTARVNDLARIRFITITRAQSGALAYGNQLVDDDDLQPLYDDASFSIIEGTLLSYDWATGQILAPVLSQPTWPDMHYNTMLAMGKREGALAGYPVRRDVRFATVRRDNIDISVALGLASGAAAIDAARPNAPQNEGN